MKEDIPALCKKLQALPESDFERLQWTNLRLVYKYPEDFYEEEGKIAKIIQDNDALGKCIGEPKRKGSG